MPLALPSLLLSILLALLLALRASAAPPGPVEMAAESSSDCNPLEVLFDSSNITLPWVRGHCCNASASAIRCDGSGRVVAAMLQGFSFGAQLSCQIPEDIATLTELQELDLSWNSLWGDIPDLSALSKLRKLVLSSNRLNGTIPLLGDLSNLVSLDLSANQLSGPIPSFAGLRRLQALDISSQHYGQHRNNFTTPLPPLDDLVSLQSFVASYAGIPGPIPPSLSLLANLSVLDLSHNALTGPLPNLSNTSLTALYLSDNPDLMGSVDTMLPSTLTVCSLASSPSSSGAYQNGLTTCTNAYPSSCRPADATPRIRCVCGSCASVTGAQSGMATSAVVGIAIGAAGILVVGGWLYGMKCMKDQSAEVADYAPLNPADTAAASRPLSMRSTFSELLPAYSPPPADTPAGEQQPMLRDDGDSCPPPPAYEPPPSPPSRQYRQLPPVPTAAPADLGTSPTSDARGSPTGSGFHLSPRAHSQSRREAEPPPPLPPSRRLMLDAATRAR